MNHSIVFSSAEVIILVQNQALLSIVVCCSTISCALFRRTKNKLHWEEAKGVSQPHKTSPMADPPIADVVAFTTQTMITASVYTRQMKPEGSK
jgi:hypothetical protein